MDKNLQFRENWGSKIGLIILAIGNAVGRKGIKAIQPDQVPALNDAGAVGTACWFYVAAV